MVAKAQHIAVRPAVQPSIAKHPPVSDIRDLLSFRIALLSAASDRLGQRWLADEFELRILEWRVIGMVAAHRIMRFFELAQALIVDKGQLSRIVRALTGRGLLLSTVDPDDQRTVQLGLSAEGRRLHDQVLRRAVERNQNVVSALNTEELQTLFGLLDKLQPFMTHRAEPVRPTSDPGATAAAAAITNRRKR